MYEIFIVFCIVVVVVFAAFGLFVTVLAWAEGTETRDRIRSQIKKDLTNDQRN